MATVLINRKGKRYKGVLIIEKSNVDCILVASEILLNPV